MIVEKVSYYMNLLFFWVNSDPDHVFCSYFIYLFIYFWPHHSACGILAFQPGMEPGPWPTREDPGHVF